MQVEYDPEQTDYAELLHLFWHNHDPTSRNKPQYMSAIFYHDDEQKRLAEETMSEHQAKVTKPITTKILPAETFYDAEQLVIHVFFFVCLIFSEALSYQIKASEFWIMI